MTSNVHSLSKTICAVCACCALAGASYSDDGCYGEPAEILRPMRLALSDSTLYEGPRSGSPSYVRYARSASVSSEACSSTVYSTTVSTETSEIEPEAPEGARGVQYGAMTMDELATLAFLEPHLNTQFFTAFNNKLNANFISGLSSDQLLELAAVLCKKATSTAMKLETVCKILHRAELAENVPVTESDIVEWIELIIQNGIYRALQTLLAAAGTVDGDSIGIKLSSSALGHVIRTHVECSREPMDIYYLLNALDHEDPASIADEEVYQILKAFLRPDGAELHPSVEQGVRLVPLHGLGFKTLSQIVALFGNRFRGSQISLFAYTGKLPKKERALIAEQVVRSRNFALIADMYGQVELKRDFIRDSSALQAAVDTKDQFKIFKLVQILCDREIITGANLVLYLDILDGSACPFAAVSIFDHFGPEQYEALATNGGLTELIAYLKRNGYVRYCGSFLPHLKGEGILGLFSEADVLEIIDFDVVECQGPSALMYTNWTKDTAEFYAHNFKQLVSYLLAMDLSTKDLSQVLARVVSNAELVRRINAADLHEVFTMIVPRPDYADLLAALIFEIPNGQVFNMLLGEIFKYCMGPAGSPNTGSPSLAEIAQKLAASKDKLGFLADLRMPAFIDYLVSERTDAFEEMLEQINSDEFFEMFEKTRSAAFE
ncbi:hypothetical protein PAPHI01_2517 [Pancytospora philotis]|nr:hypothetical protein PAPHI01_2517 [Pancytospora philotis]